MTIHTNISAPDYDYAQDPRQAYLEWLRMEARLLQMELAPKLDPELEFSPSGTFSHCFHFPIQGTWTDVPKPSTRALQVLRAAGVEIPGEDRQNALMPLMSHPGAFLHEVDSDAMMPTYRKHYSAVICMPVTHYMGEAVYLVDGHLRRAQKAGKYILLTCDNSVYPDQRVHMDTFATATLAMVVADVTVRNTTLMRAAS